MDKDSDIRGITNGSLEQYIALPNQFANHKYFALTDNEDGSVSLPTNTVTTDTEQTISGAKTFTNAEGIKVGTGTDLLQYRWNAIFYKNAPVLQFNYDNAQYLAVGYQNIYVSPQNSYTVLTPNANGILDAYNLGTYSSNTGTLTLSTPSDITLLRLVKGTFSEKDLTFTRFGLESNNLIFGTTALENDVIHNYTLQVNPSTLAYTLTDTTIDLQQYDTSIPTDLHADTEANTLSLYHDDAALSGQTPVQFKTVNGQSIFGTGDITVLPALPSDSDTSNYVLKSIKGTLTWVKESNAIPVLSSVPMEITDDTPALFLVPNDDGTYSHYAIIEADDSGTSAKTAVKVV